jgi:hypothetical protein
VADVNVMTDRPAAAAVWLTYKEPQGGRVLLGQRILTADAIAIEILKHSIGEPGMTNEGQA